MKSTAHEPGRGTKKLDLQIGEFQLAHFVSSALIAIAISRKRLLPPGDDRATRVKSQIARMPIALHEPLEVASIPRFDLAVQNVADLCGRRLCRFLLFSRGERHRDHRQQDRQSRVQMLRHCASWSFRCSAEPTQRCVCEYAS